MRLLVDEHELDWEQAWEITGTDVRLHEPHAAARSAREVAAAALRRAAAAAPRDHLRDQPPLPRRRARCGIPGDDERLAAAVAHRRSRAAGPCAWRIWRASAATRSTASRRCTPSCSSRPCSAISTRWRPEKFFNVTNGVTPRRWIALSNPKLSALITRADRRPVGRRISRTSSSGSSRSPPIAAFQQRVAGGQGRQQAALADLIKAAHRRSSSIPQSLFDIQVKRLHEYKRQHLNVLYLDHAVQPHLKRTAAPTSRRARSSSAARPRPATGWPS